ncbi:MAG: hypothetical protein ACXVZO_07820, partial [Gaiellaceae bacterium]
APLETPARRAMSLIVTLRARVECSGNPISLPPVRWPGHCGRPFVRPVNLDQSLGCIIAGGHVMGVDARVQESLEACY